MPGARRNRGRRGDVRREWKQLGLVLRNSTVAGVSEEKDGGAGTGRTTMGEKHGGDAAVCLGEGGE